MTIVRQKINIPKGLECSICPANDPKRQWRRYVTQREAVGEKLNSGSGAVVVRVNDWLLLTRWDNLAKASQHLKLPVNEPSKPGPRDPQKLLFALK